MSDKKSERKAKTSSEDSAQRATNAALAFGKAVIIPADPNAATTAPSDDAGWTKVVDKSKDKREQKKAQKKLQELTEKGLDEAKARALLANGDVDLVKEAKSKSSSGKKKGGSKKKGPQISNGKQLASVISTILASTPLGTRLHISAIGDRLHHMTGASWNQKFKKTYGSLKEFVDSRSEFKLGKDDVVWTKAEYDNVKSRESLNLHTGRKRKSAAASSPAPTSPTTSDASDSESSGSSGSSSRKHGHRARVDGESSRSRSGRRGASSDGDDDSSSSGGGLRMCILIMVVIFVLLGALLFLDDTTGVTSRLNQLKNLNL